MATHLQRAIQKLMELLMALSAKVENSVQKAVQSLEEKDSQKAQQVIKDDMEIDKREIDIEEECLKIFALHQPVAIDLRYLVAVMKINNDLERIGDLAQNISYHSLKILETPMTESFYDFKELYGHVSSMLKRCLDAIVNLNEDVAREILKEDEKVDGIYHEMSAEMVALVKKSPGKADTILQYLHIGRHLERIADHTTNIAEDIIYLISGEIARHNTAITRGTF